MKKFYLKDSLKKILGKKAVKKLYIRVAKSGSTSLSAAFDKSVVEVTPSQKGEMLYGLYDFDYAFTFIRNPYDRVVSAYNMLTKSDLARAYYQAMDKKDILDIPFDVFIRKVIEFRKTCREHGLEKKHNIHLRPWRKKREIRQNRYAYEMYWILAHTEGMVDSIEYFMPVSELDFVGRYESLDRDYEHICSILGVSGSLPQLNVSANRKKYADYYDDETLALVTEIYQKDLHVFGYQFD